jgi:hypothetical protein
MGLPHRIGNIVGSIWSRQLRRRDGHVMHSVGLREEFGHNRRESGYVVFGHDHCCAGGDEGIGVGGLVPAGSKPSRNQDRRSRGGCDLGHSSPRPRYDNVAGGIEVVHAILEANRVPATEMVGSQGHRLEMIGPGEVQDRKASSV